jgi:CRISPR-associated protein Csx14
MRAYTHTLLATLGGQPQVITFTLDELLRRDIPISEVIVIHPEASQRDLQHSLEYLNAEFIGDRYQVNGRTIHLRSHVLRLDDDTLLEDIIDDISATGALDTIHQLIRDLKQQYRCIHLSVTGGRRLMALTAISAAQLNFKHNIDHIWHIYTPEEIQQQARHGRLMHLSPEESVTLIEIPFVPWRTYFSTMPQLDDASAKTVLRSQIAEVDAQEHKRCKQVEQALTKGQLKVLRAFAKGMNPHRVAETLCIVPSTVSTHTSKIFVACREAWEMPENQSLNYYFLRDKFETYFDHDE